MIYYSVIKIYELKIVNLIERNINIKFDLVPCTFIKGKKWWPKQDTKLQYEVKITHDSSFGFESIYTFETTFKWNS